MGIWEWSMDSSKEYSTEHTLSIVIKYGGLKSQWDACMMQYAIMHHASDSDTDMSHD